MWQAWHDSSRKSRARPRIRIAIRDTAGETAAAAARASQRCAARRGGSCSGDCGRFDSHRADTAEPGRPCPPSIPGEGSLPHEDDSTRYHASHVRLVRNASRPCFAGLTTSRTMRRGCTQTSETAQPPLIQAAVRAQPSHNQKIRAEDRRRVLHSAPSADRRPGWSGTIHRPGCTPTGGRSAGVTWPTCTLPAGSVTTRYASIRTRGVRARSALVAMRPATPRVTADQRAPREHQASLPSRGHERADHPCCRRAACVRFGHGDCYSVFHNVE
jgi:hypothetical protein